MATTMPYARRRMRGEGIAPCLLSGLLSSALPDVRLTIVATPRLVSSVLGVAAADQGVHVATP